MKNYQATQKKGEQVVQSWKFKAEDMDRAMRAVLKREGYLVALDESIDYSLYHQRDERYRKENLGNSTLKIYDYGCFLMTLSFLAKRDPLEVNKLLKENGGFSGSLIVSQVAAKLLNLDLLKGDDPTIPGKMNDINYMPKFNTAKEVKLARSQHFVVRLIDADGNRTIFDPWEGKIMPVNFYPFVSYRLFKVK